MKEVKFRALELDTGRWVYGYYVAQHGYYMNNSVPDLNKPVVRHYIIGDSGKHDICEETVRQYTGLKDKNGVEIYDGDIVNHNGIGFGHISYNDKHAAYKIVFKGATRKWLIDMLEREIREIEVIGNIYENPELLKAPN